MTPQNPPLFWTTISDKERMIRLAPASAARCVAGRPVRTTTGRVPAAMSGTPSTPGECLTDAQWDILEGLIPEPTRREDGRGRPWKDRRTVLNGILWVLRTGAPWADVPERYPSYQTCHRRFQQWIRSGVMKGILEALALDLKIRGTLDVKEAFIDGSFAPAKKRGTKVGKTKRGKGTKIMAVADRHGLPVSVYVESATPHEMKLPGMPLAFAPLISYSRAVPAPRCTTRLPARSEQESIACDLRRP